MRLRVVLLLLLALLPCCGCSRTTPTEAKAIAAADQDHTAYTLPPEKLVKAVALDHVGTTLHFGGEALNLLALALMLQWGIAAKMSGIAGRVSGNRWTQAGAFFLLFRGLTTLAHLPLSVYAHHVSLAYGLSVQGWGSWLLDLAKSFAIVWGLGTAGVMLLFWCIGRSPRRWWLTLWGPTVAASLLGTFLMPYVYDPLFNKFEPLNESNPALVAQLERVVARGEGITIPPERMFLMKASAKSTGLNAYVTGFGASKRVVVWDTTIAKGDTDEILLIFGHEMGHYVLNHILYGMALSFVGLLVAFWMGFYLFQALLRRFGAAWRIAGQQDWAALVVLVFVLSVLAFVGEPVQNSVSRMDEHAADVYGQEVVHGIVADPQRTGQASFQVLGETSLDDPNPPSWVEWWTGSHPPIWFRAAFAKHYDPWAPGAEPKFFKK